MKKKTTTTRLPQTLVEQLEAAKGNGTAEQRQKWSHKTKPSRKELRKQERLGSKRRKAEFFSASQNAAPKRGADEEHTDSPPRKKAKVASESTKKPKVSVVDPQKPSAANGPAVSPSKPAKATTPAKRKKTALEKLAGRPDPVPASRMVRTQKEKEEDAYIAYLEAKLGYGKSKKTKEDDGLDDLFDFADSLENSSYPAPAGSDNSDLDEEEDVLSELSEDWEDEESSDADEDEEEDDGQDEWHGIPDMDVNEEDDEDVPLEGAVAEKTQPRTAYIPPHLRNRPRDDADSEALIKLTRQLKGLLNRMTEQNIASILDSIEDIYRNNRRNDVTTSLTTLIVDGIASHSSLLDSFVVLYAAFVSSLHKIIGIEFAAHFVQSVVIAYEQHYSNLGNIEPDPISQTEASTSGKECSNLIVLVSELYNFQVISCILPYDIIRTLLDNDLTEFKVELLLKIVRNSGQQLRQDDPSSLKDIIQLVQNKISDQDEALSSRTRFMVETLTNLKNNKVKRNTTLNQGLDAVERMKKFLAGLGKNRHVMAHEPLRVSLQDLHSAESKGKWWLVGAAWGGDPLMDRQVEAPKSADRAADEASNDLGNNALLKLARKQGMNTDIRRSIFVVLMSSDDYVDACERLSQLNLTEVQQREIVRVLLHCCGNEKTYNPYYTLVCQHLCRSSHSYKITLQFCLWDFLRDLGEVNVGGAEVIKNLKDDEDFDVKSISSSRMRNIAKAYGWWIAKDCVALAILKPVDFTALKPRSHEFLKELLVQLFVSSQTTTPIISASALPATRNRGPIEEIFIKATRVEALAMGLVYFLTEAFRDVDEMPDGLQKLVKWAGGVAKDTLRTGVDVIPSL